MGLHVIIIGTPVDGFRIVGPFKTADHAIEAADRAKIESDYWIAPLDAIDTI